MRHMLKIATLATMLFAGVSTAQAHDAYIVKEDDSVLTQMFAWFNTTYAKPERFTEAGFAQYFTDEIVFDINGKKSPKGLKSLTDRFNHLKETYHSIVIGLPLKEEYLVDDKIFTYHLNSGKEKAEDPVGGFTHVMGYVTLDNGKISLVKFLHYNEEPAEK